MSREERIGYGNGKSMIEMISCPIVRSLLGWFCMAIYCVWLHICVYSAFGVEVSS
jgi:hypothetical protein